MMSRGIKELSLNPLIVSKYNCGFSLKHRSSELPRTIGPSSLTLVPSPDLQHPDKVLYTGSPSPEGLTTSCPLHFLSIPIAGRLVFFFLTLSKRCLPVTSTLLATTRLLMEFKITFQIRSCFPHSYIGITNLMGYVSKDHGDRKKFSCFFFRGLVTVTQENTSNEKIWHLGVSRGRHS